MSVCFVVVPVVVGAWPAISAAVVAAGAAMGYQTVRKLENRLEGSLDAIGNPHLHSIEMTMPNSQVVADTLMRGESFTMERQGVQATFRVDGRGACQVHLSGEGMTDQQLQAAGTELMDRVRQQYAYAKVMQEMEERGFQVVAQDVEENNSIRIRVRRT